jgi:hypothetical protein
MTRPNVIIITPHDLGDFILMPENEYAPAMQEIWQRYMRQRKDKQ